MKPFVKAAAWFVTSTCVVWIAVLGRWRATRSDVDAADVVLGLFLLPAVVFVLVLATRWAVRSALATQDARAAARDASASVAPAPPTAPAFAEAPAAASWHLLAAGVHTAAGHGVGRLMAALEAGAPRPAPDGALHDDEGLPVMTARIADLDTEAVDLALQGRADATPTAARTLASMTQWPTRATRALASLAPLLDELAQSLSRVSPQWAGLPAADDGKKVRVHAAWPADWSDAVCAAAHTWLTGRLCDPLAAVLPPARWSIQARPMSGAELLSAATRTLDGLRREGRDDPVVLIACHSDLDAAGIRALDAGQRLFHAARRPKVAIAGEGAAVLMVSASPWPADAPIGTDRVRLTSPLIARRARSVEAAGRPAPDDTVETVRLGLVRAGLTGTDIASHASDADQHTGRAAELFAVTLALMPELDVGEAVRLAGTLCGRLEAVGPLLTIACAAAQARESGRPAVALSLGDPDWRIAAVLCPESFPTASA